MSKPITVNSVDSLSSLIGKLRELFRDKKYFQVTINTGKKRSTDQNFVFHGWCRQVSDEEKQYTPEEVKCLVKYHLGLPILRGADGMEWFNERCVKFIDPLPYEDRIKAMVFFPVTSLMTTVQLKQMMENMQANYAGRVPLEFK